MVAMTRSPLEGKYLYTEPTEIEHLWAMVRIFKALRPDCRTISFPADRMACLEITDVLMAASITEQCSLLHGCIVGVKMKPLPL